MTKQHQYIAIDLKSFYASVECVERHLDPLTVNLVVADTSRTEKTICLAVSPSLKTYGISRIARLFEVVQRVRDINRERKSKAVFEQMNLFTDYADLEKEQKEEKVWREKERKLQEAMLSVKKKFGKNAILKGMNLQEGAMAIERNRQIGGHKA